MSLETASTSLPVLALPGDILFPATQLTVNLPRAFLNPLTHLIRDVADSGATPLVAAVPSSEPIVNAKDLDGIKLKLHEWGCVARVIRLVKPSVFNPSYCTVTLGGLSRVRLHTPYPPSSKLTSLPLHPVDYPPQTKSSLSEPAAETFRACALKFLERLDVSSKSKTPGGDRVDWRSMKVIVEEAEVDRLPWVADILVAVTPSLPWPDRLALLAAYQPDERLRLASTAFGRHMSIAEVSQKINSAVDESLSKQQKEYYLRQQLHAIQKELASLHKSGKKDEAGADNREGGSELDEDGGDEDAFMSELKEMIEVMEKGSEERRMAAREYQRLKRIPPTSVEHGVIRTYLEWLTSLPWPNTVKDQNRSVGILKDPNFLSRAREQLETDHFGLEMIKKRLIEHMAVIRLKALNALAEQAKEVLHQQVIESSDTGKTLAIRKAPPQGVVSPVDTEAAQIIPIPKKPKVIKTKGPILLLVGPPGCGKTSIAASLAKALDRPFQRISLGGVRDEAEIRGHRRTYVASGPGAIVSALSKAKRLDPVILLDEIDKVGRGSYQGDPSAALLEVLDPEQNANFKDHYINVPLDLSQVLFVATANSLDTVSDPLLDRCEVIQLSGYTYDEKIHIARRFLLPKQLEANGLPPNHITLTDAAYTHVASYYTREAGVRNLERCVGAIARSKAVQWAEFVDTKKKGENTAYQNIVDAGDLERILGIARWDPLERDREERRGLVYGLVVSGMGEGGVLPVESVMTSGAGKLRLTGSLGDVIRESGEIALSWVKSNSFALGITSSLSQDPLKVPEPVDIHLHLPSGATKKDGPSAGVAYVCAFVSLLTGFTVPSSIAITGETTLRGKVTAVGGIKEKVLGAHREGIKKIILPRTNRKDVEYDVPPEVHRDIQFVYVSRVEEALEAAFGRRVFDPSRAVMESRL